MGIQNYYRLATDISIDCNSINRAVMTVLTNRLRTQKGSRLVKTGRTLTEVERKRYGKSKMLRYVAGTEEPIYPIGHVQCINPMFKKRNICSYTADGRKEIHDNLRINTSLMLKLMAQPLHNRSAEYADNRISLFSAQWGKGAVIKNTSGVRKMRYAFQHRGKRGSVRVIYVDFEVHDKIFLITAYAKEEKDNLSEAEKKEIRQLVRLLEQQLEENK